MRSIHMTSTEDFDAFHDVPDRILKVFKDQSDLLPESLTKFCDHRGLGILLNGELKVTPPRDFNGPFEFSPGVWEREPSRKELREHFLARNGFPRRYYLHQFANEARYIDWVENVALNRPDLAPKHLCWLREVVRANLSMNLGVACFSAFTREQMETAASVRHWAFYGGNHGGLAIEFNGRHELFKKWARMKMCFYVDYRPKRPECRLADFRDTSWRADLLRARRWGSVKSKAWCSESEWRLVTRLIDCPKIPLRRAADGERMTYFFATLGQSRSGSR